VEPVEHLFRRESGRLVAALTRIFGVHNLALAEDVVQDVFCRALEVWKFRGAPDNPSAWLMTAARNRAIDVLRRERTARTYAPELGRLLESEWTLTPVVDELFGPQAVQDGLLRMMFSCCHPRVREEGQVALMLHILCGFSVDEVAGAFVASRAAIEKRISRAKAELAGSGRLLDVTDGAALAERLPAVQRALYLLFNEGYHGACPEAAVRTELCEEALRLVGVLLEHPAAATPESFALAALLHLHAARLPARLGAHGDLQSFAEQDRSLWDQARIAQGMALLERSAEGVEATVYHVEAAIACYHALAPRAEDTDWESIVALYDTLLALNPSPVVALNRAIAVAQHAGPERGLLELRAIPDAERLARYPFYPAALGEMELRRGALAAASGHFRDALGLARNPTERHFFEQRLAACASG
jgi:RNA polymerase sigma factor (sigma-70 family)